MGNRDLILGYRRRQFSRLLRELKNLLCVQTWKRIEKKNNILCLFGKIANNNNKQTFFDVCLYKNIKLDGPWHKSVGFKNYRAILLWLLIQHTSWLSLSVDKLFKSNWWVDAQQSYYSRLKPSLYITSVIY